MEFYRRWSGRLIVDWPGGKLSWWRWAEKNIFKIVAIAEDSLFEPPMPDWKELSLGIAELQALPNNWRDALVQWRGVYFIFDTSDQKGYVGSAYGKDNILGRWLTYAATGHGGNVELKGRSPVNFLFSILERVSPDMEKDDVIHLEGLWKKRLQTFDFGLNGN